MRATQPGEVKYIQQFSLFCNGLKIVFWWTLHTVIWWMSPFVIVGVSGLFCRFYSIFDGKSCLQIM